MNYPAASRRGIAEELVLQFAASSGELTPLRLEKKCQFSQPDFRALMNNSINMYKKNNVIIIYPEQ